MAQNVSASLKAKNLWPRWMKMAKKYTYFSVMASPTSGTRWKCNTHISYSKILKGSGESLLIWTLPAWCKNCFSLFQFVLVSSTFGILT